jgi:hypothetical protein
MPTVVAASTSPGPIILRRSPTARGVSSRAIVVADSSVLKRSPLSRTTDRDRRRCLRKGRASPTSFPKCRSPWATLSPVNPSRFVGVYRLMPIGQRLVMSKQPALIASWDRRPPMAWSSRTLRHPNPPTASATGRRGDIELHPPCPKAKRTQTRISSAMARERGRAEDDLVDCGRGRDTVLTDNTTEDTILSNCEVVRRG